MYESTTVTVGLDVHARSIRLAAVRADELLEEQTLPLRRAGGRASAAPLAGGALLLRGGPDGLRPLPPPGRARDRLRGRRTGLGTPAAGRPGQDRPAGCAQARAAAR